LRVRTLEKFPIDYALTQYNIGITYHALAEVEDRGKNYNLAIKAYRESLKVFTKKNIPENRRVIKEKIKKCSLQNMK